MPCSLSCSHSIGYDNVGAGKAPQHPPAGGEPSAPDRPDTKALGLMTFGLEPCRCIVDDLLRALAILDLRAGADQNRLGGGAWHEPLLHPAENCCIVQIRKVLK